MSKFTRKCHRFLRRCFKVRVVSVPWQQWLQPKLVQVCFLFDNIRRIFPTRLFLSKRVQQWKFSMVWTLFLPRVCLVWPMVWTKSVQSDQYLCLGMFGLKPRSPRPKSVWPIPALGRGLHPGEVFSLFSTGPLPVQTNESYFLCTWSQVVSIKY